MNLGNWYVKAANHENLSQIDILGKPKKMMWEMSGVGVETMVTNILLLKWMFSECTLSQKASSLYRYCFPLWLNASIDSFSDQNWILVNDLIRKK